MNQKNLRQKAEALLRDEYPLEDLVSFENVSRVLHELRVHQIELEMQNDQLNKAQRELESVHQKYIDHYELAPVGYFMFDRNGLVIEVNLTGASLLGRQRDRLLHKPFVAYLTSRSRATFLSHLQTVQATEFSHTCELAIQRMLLDGSLIYVQMESRLASSQENGELLFRSVIMDVTDRHRAEEALRSNEALLEATIESLPFEFFALDSEGRYFLQNSISRRCWGGNIIGKYPRELVTKKNFETVSLQNNQRAFAGETIKNELEYVLEGKKKYSYNIITPIWVNDQVEGIVGVNIDVTDRREAEELVREHQSKLQIILDAVPAMVFFKDKQNRLLMVNKAYTEFTGLPREALEGQSAFDLSTNQELADIYWQDDLQVINTGQPKRNILEPLFTDETRWFQTDKIPYRDITGQIIGVVGFSVEITERRQAEMALARSEARLRAVINNVTDGIITIDDQGLIASFNSAAETIFGYTAEEVIGQNVKILMPEPYCHHHDFYLAEYKRTGEAHIIGHGREVLGRRKGGVIFPLDLAISELVLDDHTMFIGLVRDITDRKEAELEIQQAHQKLTQAYDETLAGWARALELRDKETEGHSQRVTEMTVRLACEMGIFGETLIHVRRGALLHDIGKMGVPDHILLKRGPLDDHEWGIMRQHPVYAYQMLSPIAYLRPALAIPYCHHERWDGSGYPRGLQGTEIPLAARIFAVVDVWDALSSDRPYREAWSRQDVVAYLRIHAGHLFDPQIVEKFLKIIEQDLLDKP